MNDLEKTVQEARAVVQKWMDKQGHDRCWYYPDLFRKLAEILGVKPSKDISLPPREEFEEGCRRYQQEEYDK